MIYENLIYQKGGGIAKITTDRPEVMNALNQAVLLEIKAAVQEARKDDDVGVVVLTGAGRAFCAGADVRETLLQAGIEKREKEGAGDGIDVIYRSGRLSWASVRKPVIASINGYAIGIG